MNPFQMISPTSFAVYGDCPKQFGLRYRQWAKTPGGVHMLAGRYVQTAIERCLRMTFPETMPDAEVDSRARRALSMFIGEEIAACGREARDHPGIDQDGLSDRWGAMMHTWAMNGLEMHLSLLRNYGEGRLAADWGVMRPRMFGDGDYLVAADETHRGKPDLAYPIPGAGTLLVDMKVGSGRDDKRRQNAVDQLRIYGLLWRDAHEETPAAEIWYLGSREVVNVAQMHPHEADNFRDAVRAIHDDEALEATPKEEVCLDCFARRACAESGMVDLPDPDGDPLGPAPEFSAVVLGIGDTKDGKNRVSIGVQTHEGPKVMTFKWAHPWVRSLRCGRAYRFWCRVWSSKYQGRQLDLLSQPRPLEDHLADIADGATPPLIPHEENRP